MNQNNTLLQNIRTTREHLQLQKKHTYNIKTLHTLTQKIEELEKEEQKLLQQIGVHQ